MALAEPVAPGIGQHALAGEEVDRATPLALRFKSDNTWAGKAGKGEKSQYPTIHTPRAKGKGGKGCKDRDGGMVDGMDRHTWAIWLKFCELAAG